MVGMRLCCSLILAVQALAFQAPSGVVEGSVIDSASGEPIQQANVTLMAIPIVMGIRPSAGALGDFYDPTQMPATRLVKSPPAVLTTDAEGKFRAVLAPGRYDVRAARNGYVAAPAGLTALSLIPGETLKGVTLKLTRQATIGGSVVDVDGKPLAQFRVQCLRWTTMGPYGHRALTPHSNTATDEQGEYRIAGVTPGRYVIAVETNVTLFAPGVTNLAAARAIEITPGAAPPGIDLRVPRVPVVEVSGKVTGGAASVTLLPRDPALLMSANRYYSAAVNQDGTFAVRDVPPGAYALQASGISGPNQQRLSGRLDVDVDGKDVGSLAVAVQPSVSLQGKVRFEGDPRIDSLSFFFQPRAVGVSGAVSSRVDAEGRFTVGALDLETYRIVANGLPNGYYVKSIQLGGVDATRELHLTAPGELVVTLDHGTAEVSGRVLDKKERPASDVQVLLVNAGGEIVRGTTSLIDGQYRITELPPGAYRLFPVIDVDISDPATLDRLIATSPQFTLARSAREVRDLQVP